MKITRSSKSLLGVLLTFALLASLISATALTAFADDAEETNDTKYVEKLSVTCSDPHTGNTVPKSTVQGVVTGSSDLLDLNATAYWEYCSENSANDADWLSVGAGDEFAAGYYYRVTYTVEFNVEYYSFAENLTAYINGKASTTPVADILKDDKTAQFRYEWYVFEDTPTDSFYYDAVQWALFYGVTTGINPTQFVPNGTCTREQFVTFLWRANGSPEPASAENPFTDVAAGTYYYDAVLWAYENGYTTGVSSTLFGVGDPCLREQIVTFIWRSAGKPAATVSNPFNDVPAGQYYTEAVLWAVEKQITTGTSETTFSPTATALRGQVVTFLYRLDGIIRA